MKKIKIMNEFLHSPIWCYEDDDICTEFPLLTEDAALQKLSKRIEDLYSDYYEFNSHDLPCWFNYEKEKADKDLMLGLISALIFHLNEINDGSFMIEDTETERLKKL